MDQQQYQKQEQRKQQNQEQSNQLEKIECQFCGQEAEYENIYDRSLSTYICVFLLCFCFIIPGCIGFFSKKIQDKRSFCSNCGLMIYKMKYKIL